MYLLIEKIIIFNFVLICDFRLLIRGNLVLIFGFVWWETSLIDMDSDRYVFPLGKWSQCVKQIGQDQGLKSNLFQGKVTESLKIFEADW